MTNKISRGTKTQSSAFGTDLTSIPKTTNKIVRFSLFIIFIMLVGCTGIGKNGSKTSESEVIFTGIEGLTAEFGKNAPPLSIFESGDFPILIRIANKGAYNIPQYKGDGDGLGIMAISREKDYITSISLEKNSRGVMEEDRVYFHVDGKTQLNQKGDEVVLSFNAKSGKLEPQSEHKQSTITATLCYPYQTNLSTTICIDPDVAGIRPGKKACNVKDMVFSSQGAPIAITKIQTQMIPKSVYGGEEDNVYPQFLIFVENKGKGQTVNVDDYISVCGSGSSESIESIKDKKNIWNVASLKAFTSGNEQLICCPNEKGQCPENGNDKEIKEIAGFIRFRDKKDFVRCTFKDGISKNSDVFTSPLKIQIDYGYVQTFTKDILIQKLLSY